MADGRGGARLGREGRLYPNRSDLNANAQKTQPARAARGQGYGERKAQEDAQRAIPLPQIVPLDAPTQRPEEPITAGLPTGPGPEALGLPQQNTDAVLLELQALYNATGFDEIRRLIERRSG